MGKALDSDLALLDIKKGRNKIRKRVEKGEVIPVVITGYIDTVWSHNDGFSQEFAVCVTSAMEIDR